MRQAAKALIRDDQGRILVLYRSETHPCLAFDVDLPGGIIDTDELIEEGLAREIYEETGLELAVGDDHLRHSWQTDCGDHHFLYEVEGSSVENVAISWEHHDHAWLSADELIEHRAIDGFMHQVQAWLRQGL